jgi:hypothetical protein
LKDDGVVDKLVLLDLQMIKYARPTVDLAYFLGSSSTAKFRKTHLKHLQKVYHDSLSQQLVKFGYPLEIYPFTQFITDFDETWVFGFTTGCMHVQVYQLLI